MTKSISISFVIAVGLALSLAPAARAALLPEVLPDSPAAPPHTTQPSLVTATYVSGRLKEVVQVENFTVTKIGTGRLPGNPEILYKYTVKYDDGSNYAEEIFFNISGICVGRRTAPH